VISGFHTIIYSDDADATRAFFRDVLGWPSLDAGGGWLIFKTPPSELGVHPTSGDADERWATVPFHQSSLMCDDIEATIAELQGKGVAVKTDVKDQGFGLVTSFAVPGAGWMMLYQPRHGLAHELNS
jgi:catechol 2,3-dioxygenase-like lactoylglutathione lyase family enzyme